MVQPDQPASLLDWCAKLFITQPPGVNPAEVLSCPATSRGPPRPRSHTAATVAASLHGVCPSAPSTCLLQYKRRKARAQVSCQFGHVAGPARRRVHQLGRCRRAAMDRPQHGTRPRSQEPNETGRLLDPVSCQGVLQDADNYCAPCGDPQRGRNQPVSTRGDLADISS